MQIPTLIYHADWSSHAVHRRCAKAILGADGQYTATAPEPVGDPKRLIESLRLEVGDSGIVFAGFDFPIGISEHYAERAHISRFREFLRQLGTGDWKYFYSVCDTPEEITVHRPFYPQRYSDWCSHQLFLERHGSADMASLLRQCERGGDSQRQACCLFWTLGGNQVGKAAIVGWQDVLVPGLQSPNPVRLWPFEGTLDSLLQPGSVVIAETYPAEFYRWFPGEPLGSKTSLVSRLTYGDNLVSWAEKSRVIIDPSLRAAIEDGFQTGEDDAFDAVVGLFGMLQIVLGQRGTGEPDHNSVRNIEGWILGRRSQPLATATVVLSATTDPELTGWLRWAANGGEVPTFVHAIAEAAFLADLPNYALLRPVLLKLKKRNSRVTEPPTR